MRYPIPVCRFRFARGEDIANPSYSALFLIDAFTFSPSRLNYNASPTRVLLDLTISVLLDNGSRMSYHSRFKTLEYMSHFLRKSPTDK